MVGRGFGVFIEVFSLLKSSIASLVIHLQGLIIDAKQQSSFQETVQEKLIDPWAAQHVATPCVSPVHQCFLCFTTHTCQPSQADPLRS